MGNGSLVRRRQLARQLRAMRERAGLTLEAAAPELDWSASKLSRIETAQQGLDVHGLRSMMDLYQVDGETWKQMLAMCREGRQRGWWRAYGLGDDSYVGFETEDPIEIRAVIDECMLHRPVGGPRVLAEQMRYLLEASRLPTVTLCRYWRPTPGLVARPPPASPCSTSETSVNPVSPTSSIRSVRCSWRKNPMSLPVRLCSTGYVLRH